METALSDDSLFETCAETDDDVLPPNHRRKHGRPKKSKNRRLSNAGAADFQRMAQRRVAEQEGRKQVINLRLAKEANDADHIPIPVNFKEPLVLLDQHIAQRIKPHQVAGVQFIWREVVEDAQQQGCLLAHTMGLGKTMQVISVLVTIAQCVRSANPDIKAHIPKRLHDLRILVLSPPALGENWFDELMFWMPEHDTLGPIYKITSSTKHPYHDVKQWSESGGVILLGYDRLVSYTREPKRASLETDEQYNLKLARHKDLTQWLLELPTIVVADEAHMLRNPAAKRADTAMKIQTTSRIALTGSPLSNHLEEYWAMINFIAPNYLGDLKKFKRKFVEPINRSISVESNTYDRRLGLRKMHVLKKILDPKVDRADITAIQNDLPPKTEFFITVALTDLQLEMYKVCVRSFRGAFDEAGIGKPKNTSLWQWIAVLSLLCSHPWTFDKKLKDPERRYKVSRQSFREADDDEEEVGHVDAQSDDLDASLLPTMLEVMKAALSCWNDRPTDDLRDPMLSNRSLLVEAIVRESLSLDEKVLIFSHSLLTLDYMELILDNLNCPFDRIDGGSATDKRQRAAKEFNAGISRAKVFLISTRAGGLGLNLYGATRVIILDYSFNPSWEEQAIGRAYRLGQKRPVFVYRFRSGGTFEDVTFNQTIFKTQLFTRIIDHKAVLRKGSKMDAGKYLFDPKPPVLEDFSGCIGKDPAIMDKIIQRFDCVQNIVLTETFVQDIDENLTAKEIEEADKEIEDERLARQDPAAYAIRVAAREAEIYMRGQRSSPMSSFSNATATFGVDRIRTIINGTPIAYPRTFDHLSYTPQALSPAVPGTRQSYSDDTVSQTLQRARSSLPILDNAGPNRIDMSKSQP